MIDRRTLLIASAASLMAGSARAAEPTSRDAELAALLDHVQHTLPVPGPNYEQGFAEAIRKLHGFDPSGLSPIRRLELQAVANGLLLELRSGRGYGAELSLALGKTIDPRAAHRTAEAEAGRLQARADALLRARGLMQGTVGDRIGRLMADEHYLYSGDDAGRDKAVAAMNAWQAQIRPRLSPAFDDLAIPSAEARRMSAADEARGRPGYRDAGTFDKPGAYYVDLKAIRTRPSWTLPAVVHHELIPGHLLQLPYQTAANPHPLRLRYAKAYFEAWGIYAEQLASDLGLMSDDPLAEIGALHWRLFRLARIAADTGLHALHWSQEQAIDAMRRIQGPPIAFVDIPADVKRMAGEPATYAAQGLGALELARLRSGRDWPAFHRAVLENGPWPFFTLGVIAGAVPT